MKISGQYRIPAPRATVWQALNDASVLKDCIPGCQSLERLSDNEMVATVRAKVGPVSATFKGNVSLSNVDPPNGCRISGEGQGGAAGFAKGAADVVLSENGDGTTQLAYTAEAQVGGKLAQVGARLIDATAKQMADQFFGAFTEKLGGEGVIARAEHAVEDAVHEVAEAAHHAEERAETAAARGFLGGPQIWALLVLVAVIVLLAVLTR